MIFKEIDIALEDYGIKEEELCINTAMQEQDIVSLIYDIDQQLDDELESLKTVIANVNTDMEIKPETKTGYRNKPKSKPRRHPHKSRSAWNATRRSGCPSSTAPEGRLEAA